MHVSKGVRILLVVLAGFAGLMALVSYSIEQEYGGQSAIEGLAKGYLPAGAVEVREVDWGLGAEAANDYEVTVKGSGVVFVRLVNGNGLVLYTGTETEAVAWLDAQGPQLFVGTNQSADVYLSDLRDSAKSYTTSIVLAIVAVGLLVVAVIPARKTHQADAIGPAMPTS